MAVDLNLLSSNSLNNIETNFQRVKTALQDSVGRSGVGPNHMNADIDLNGHDILNVRSIEVEEFNGVDFKTITDEVNAAADRAEQAAEDVEQLIVEFGDLETAVGQATAAAMVAEGFAEDSATSATEAGIEAIAAEAARIAAQAAAAGITADLTNYLNISTAQSTNITQKEQGRSNLGINIGFVPSGASLSDINGIISRFNTIWFTSGVSINATLNLSGLSNKTFVSTVPSGTATITMTNTAQPAINISGDDINFLGNWRITGNNGGIGIDVVGALNRVRFEFLWLERFDIGLRGYMTSADLDLLHIDRFYMREIFSYGVTLKGSDDGVYHVTQVSVGDLSFRRYTTAGDTCTWIHLGQGVGSNGNNGFIQTGVGLVYGGTTFLHTYSTETPAGYVYYYAPRKIRVDKVGIRGTKGTGVFLEMGQEIILHCNVDDAGDGDTTAHGIHIGKNFQGDYTLHDNKIVNCQGNAVRDEAVNGLSGRIVGGIYDENSFSSKVGAYSGLYFDSRVRNRTVIGLRVGAPERYRRASAKVTFTNTPTNGDTITINGHTITMVTGSPAANQIQISSNLVTMARNLEQYIINSSNAALVNITTMTVPGNILGTASFFGITVVSGEVYLLFKPGSVYNGTTISTTSSNVTLSGSTFTGGTGTINERWGINGILNGRRGCVISGGEFIGTLGDINPSPSFYTSPETA